VGELVGDDVGEGLGEAVGLMVGELVGEVVGVAESDTVGKEEVGRGVGDTVISSQHKS
jgi:hypothetical protein